MEGDGAAWSQLVEEDLDLAAVLGEVDDDNGYRKYALMGIRLAQTLHHGPDHRSQICSAPTPGVTPPAIDVWDFELQDGRVVEVRPAS